MLPFKYTLVNNKCLYIYRHNIQWTRTYLLYDGNILHMVYDVNDDPLPTSGLGTYVVSSRLWCHVVWWHVTTSTRIVIKMLALVSNPFPNC